MPEARLAREAELPYALVGMVTDYDCWKADEEHVTVDLIVENLHRNAALAQAIVADVLPRIPAAPSWPCHDALRTAILTGRALWPASTLRRLAPILKRYA